MNLGDASDEDRNQRLFATGLDAMVRLEVALVKLHG